MFIIQEIQTSKETTALTPAITKDDLNQAESTFHSICASAAISSVDIHAVVIIDEHGSVIRKEFYEHLTES